MLCSIDLSTMPSIIKNDAGPPVQPFEQMEELDLPMLLLSSSDSYSFSWIVAILIARTLLIHCMKVVE